MALVQGPAASSREVTGLPHAYGVEVVGLLVSPVHRYAGRPGGGVPPQDGDRVSRVEVRAGHGVVGDRYAGRAAHRDAAGTVLAAESVEALRGEEFSLDCGEGVVVLRGGRPANPCAWLDTVLAPGAHRGLRGRAGIRCAALSDGVLRLGPAVLAGAVPLDPARAGYARRPAPRPRPA